MTIVTGKRIRCSLIATAMLCLVGAQALGGQTTAPTDEHAGHHMHGESPAAAVMPGDSLYQLPVQLETAAGTQLTLDQYRGAPLVVTMFYGTCKSVCPLLTRAMKATAAALPGQRGEKVRFLMVTLDPERDTAAELARFATENDLAAPRFQVARTDANGVRLLAASLGIRYRQLPDGNFSHSSVLTVLDAQGVPAARTENITGADAQFVATTSGLAL